jgi:hypothetical protein
MNFVSQLESLSHRNTDITNMRTTLFIPRRSAAVMVAFSLVLGIGAPLLLSAAPAAQAAAEEKPVCPPIISDTSDAPDLKEWAAKAEKECQKWYADFARTLGSEESRLPKAIKINYTTQYNGVAACSGDTITVSAKWIREHPDDMGCILHEMSHFQQSYPKYDPVWLVEGISDYVRWFMYEPESKRPKVNPAKASARDSYRTTGAFLDYLSKKYDKNIVRKLSKSLKESRYDESYFKDLTGKTLDELNTEWLASLKPAS